MPLKLLIQLSWRNIWRHRRRNGIMLLAICFAVGGVVFLNSLIRGMQYEMAEAAIDNLTGHVKILKPGYLDDPSIEKSFALAKEWGPELSDEVLVGWAARVRVPAVLMSERETRGVQLVGIDPASESISFFGDVDMAGETLASRADRRIVIGKTMAEQLETVVGRRVVLISQGADGLNREAGYRIAGIYDAAGTGLEKIYVFTGMDTVQGMLDANVVTEVSFRLTEDRFSQGVIDRLVNSFTGVDVLTWQELEPQAAAMYAFADTGIFIWFLIVMGALVFGLVNTLVTAVMERVRELGMLRAVGMRARSVVVQVVLESSLIMLLGVAAGVGLGLVLFALVADGIDLSAFAEGVEMAGLRTLFVPVLVVDDIVLVVVMSLVLGVVASLYPARRAVKINALEAMRR
ncbi:MAG: FtsX-like permease family protein [Gammaproteobacteria bacterium]|nr:FtsX-like permease family protein [Gammaproteobacteria bacterium]